MARLLLRDGFLYKKERDRRPTRHASSPIEIVVGLRKEADAYFPVRGKPDAAALIAECLRHRSVENLYAKQQELRLHKRQQRKRVDLGSYCLRGVTSSHQILGGISMGGLAGMDSRQNSAMDL